MPVYACIHVPEFPTQALLRLRPEVRQQPVAVLEGERPFERICSRNQRAAALGVEPGMPRAEAELFDLPLLRRSFAEEASARTALLGSLATFTPSIEACESETHCTYMLDLTGTDKLLGPLNRATRTIYACISQLGLAARIATGSNFHAVLALAAAQHQRILHTPPGEAQQALAPLPLAALSLAPEQAAVLSHWGLRTLGDLAALPEVALIARMGQAGKRLRQLARGEHPHHFLPIEAPRHFEEYLEFDAPVDLLESLLFALNPMLQQLLYRVRTYACALASITVALGLEGAPLHTRTVRPALPTEDQRVLLKLLQMDLEAHPPAAGILTLRLTGETGPVSKVQIGLFSPQLPEPMRLEVTLARISAIVGEGRVGKVLLADTHAEDAFSIHKFITEAPQPKRTSHRTLPQNADPRVAPSLRRFRPPLPVLVDYHAPRLRALWHNAVCYQVQRLYGPWLASGSWWSERAWASRRWDFAAQAADGSLLAGVVVYHIEHRAWLLEGIYD